MGKWHSTMHNEHEDPAKLVDRVTELEHDVRELLAHIVWLSNLAENQSETIYALKAEVGLDA